MKYCNNTVIVLVLTFVFIFAAKADCLTSAVSTINVPKELLKHTISSSKSGDNLKVKVKGHYYGGVPYYKGYNFICAPNGVAYPKFRSYKPHGNNLFEHSGSNGKLNSNWR